jgi:hypothetical protein
MRYEQISGFGGLRWDRDEKFVQRSTDDAFTVRYRTIYSRPYRHMYCSVFCMWFAIGFYVLRKSILI